MQNYQLLELSELIELMADKTALYAKMRSMGFTETEAKECQQAMIELQVEIEHRRKATGNNATLSSPDIFFEK